MGRGYRYVCKKCGMEKNIYLGNSMFSFCKEQVMDLKRSVGNVLDRAIESEIVNLKELKKFLKLKNVNIEDDFEDDIYYCNNCYTMYGKFKFSLYAEGNIFYPIYKCKRCNSPLVLDEIPNKQYFVRCDKCNIPMEKKLFSFFWD